LLNSQFDLVIVSVENAKAGADLIRRIRSDGSLTQLRVLTIARWGTGQAMLALSQGIDAYEPKPIEADRLVAAIEKLLPAARAMAARAGSAGTNFDGS